MYIYIYIYTHTYTHTYMHAYLFGLPSDLPDAELDARESMTRKKRIVGKRQLYKISPLVSGTVQVLRPACMRAPVHALLPCVQEGGRQPVIPRKGSEG